MNAKKLSIFLAGFLWVLVAFRIGSRGIEWLSPYLANPDWKLSFLIFSFLIAFFKATKVLKKSCERNLANLEKIQEKTSHYFFGWLILYGKKGIILISIMIGLGIGLRYLRAIGIDSFNIFPFIYIGIAGALLLGSQYYFKALK